METKSFSIIVKKITSLKFNEQFDLIVGIGKGGIMPAYLLSQYLSLPLEIITVNFRGPNHKPQKGSPTLEKPFSFDHQDKKILLVDDRANTGSTLNFCQSLFPKAKLIKTLVVNGKSDYSLFDEKCFKFPWDIEK